MTDDPMLDRLLASHRTAVGARPSADHPDVDTLARHASGQLSAPRSKEVAAHLLACDDGRCVAFVRSQAEDAHATANMLYPGDEEAPARARTFQCKQGLWDTFVQIAGEIGVSLDELLEEAMTDYARSRGAIDAPTDPRRLPPEARQSVEAARSAYADPEETQGAPSARAVLTSAPPLAPRADRPSSARSLVVPTPPPGTVRMPNRPARPPQPVPASRLASMPPVPGAPPSRAAAAAPPPARGGSRPGAPPPAATAPVQAMPRSMPPLPGSGMGGPVPMSTMKSARSALPTLTLTYQGRSYVVDKDKYMLGRSKTGADLRLDDTNVSRQHAMVERVGGAYYIVDLGSTNGVFVGGERVARRALRDGDVIEITTHTIHCTLA